MGAFNHYAKSPAPARHLVRFFVGDDCVWFCEVENGARVMYAGEHVQTEWKDDEGNAPGRIYKDTDFHADKAVKLTKEIFQEVMGYLPTRNATRWTSISIYSHRDKDGDLFISQFPMSEIQAGQRITIFPSWQMNSASRASYRKNPGMIHAVNENELVFSWTEKIDAPQTYEIAIHEYEEIV